MESCYETLEFLKIREKIAVCAASVLGEKLALEIQPIQDTQELTIIQTQVTELRDLNDYDHAVPMEGIQDVEAILKKAGMAGSILGVHELLAVFQQANTSRRLSGYFYQRKEKIPHFKKISDRLIVLPELEKEISRCIDIKSAEILDNASPELAHVRSQINRVRNSIRRKIETKLKSFGEQGMLQENVISVRDGRFVLMVKDEYKRKVKGLIHGQSSSGSSYFIEPMDVFEENNRIRELLNEETREIERVLTQLTIRVHEVVGELKRNEKVLAQIDLFYAKAVFSKSINGFQPELVDNPEIMIAGGRHPLLILRLGESNVVPLDIELGKVSTLIISGPNAGGKTVALKTVGLLTLLARCGLHIPAKPHSRIGKITKIYANIGDQQSIENDLSTFSSHVQSLADIASNADENSLVLVDEIGTGTDPEEGIALAITLLQRLTDRHALTIVTTHLGALKAFAYQTDRVENASMEFDRETLQATYKFRTGIPGSSYAFEIARRMGFPPELIEASRELIGSHKDQLEGLIEDLEEKIQSYNTLLSEIRIKDSGLSSLQKLYTERNEALKRDEKKIKREAVKEAEQIIAQANALIEKTVKEIKEKEARREAIQNAKSVMNEQQQKIKVIKKQVSEPEPEALISVEPGDYVKWKHSTSVGEVITRVDKKGKVMVQLDGVKMQLPLVDLEKASKKKKKRTSVTHINVSQKEIITHEVDLRGMRAEEARSIVDRFIDEALMTGLNEIRIIHGKGTGRLRQDITNFLGSHPQVNQFRLGNWNEGDSGVTIATLKTK